PPYIPRNGRDARRRHASCSDAKPATHVHVRRLRVRTPLQPCHVECRLRLRRQRPPIQPYVGVLPATAEPHPAEPPKPEPRAGHVRRGATAPFARYALLARLFSPTYCWWIPRRHVA